MFPADLILEAEALSQRLRDAELMLTTAESCTGGLIAGLLTELPGSSDVFDRGFVTYSNAAKQVMLGVPASMIAEHGAVSEDVARAMVSGALAHSEADVGIAVTGVAGPGGGTVDKPVGLVHVAAAKRNGSNLHRRCEFGDPGRTGIRIATIAMAFELVGDVLDGPAD